MRIQAKYGLLAVFILVSALIYFLYLKPVEETIIFFPIDPSLSFDSASTHLAAEKSDDNYSINWSEQSVLNTDAYLRQDISLLYKNGRLAGILKDWRQNTQSIQQKEDITESESGLFQGLTFHYAEVHPSESDIVSAQALTDDELYVILSPFSKFQSFKRPISAEQKEWKQVLDRTAKAVMADSLNKASEAFQLDKDRYEVASLTELNTKQDELLSGFTEAKQKEIIGKLWEGLYRNYVMGIKKEDGSGISPEGSTIPLLLVSNDNKELLTVFNVSDGSPVILRQKLPSLH
ncbi:hypothetical protein ELQ35_12525 [Peribacillus cavernae]|uniref:Uncharacterized protein n=1 Tax=Peribacillus cavernae TaxID=1674310 RepID=A0A3S0U1N5_9BACI|nr:hypothetical protein [Peribacillus cavernae]MDQ0218314.1 hypothetical protein [Peribacillus cavernae]RUQ28404.1 hypothetical protein ELQ35_12525 [Peribacillus cavernae]